MRLPVVRGRDITDADNVTAPGVVIINEQAAREYWPGEDPIGKRVSFDDEPTNPAAAWLTIIGIVKNAKQDNWAVISARRLPQDRNKWELDGKARPACLLRVSQFSPPGRNKWELDAFCSSHVLNPCVTMNSKPSVFSFAKSSRTRSASTGCTRESLSPRVTRKLTRLWKDSAISLC
jgi:hypothetical protein